MAFRQSYLVRLLGVLVAGMILKCPLVPFLVTLLVLAVIEYTLSRKKLEPNVRSAATILVNSFGVTMFALLSSERPPAGAIAIATALLFASIVVSRKPTVRD